MSIFLRNFVLVIFTILCTLICGCRHTTKNQLSDWKNDDIVMSEAIYGEGWSSPIVENDTYIFYIRKDNKIVRFDKEKEEKVEIVEMEESTPQGMENLEDNISAVLVSASDKKLYYHTKNEIYQCDFDGKHRKKIFSKENLKNQSDEDVSSIDAIHIEDDNIYLILESSYIAQMNIDQKKMKIIAEETNGESCFYKNDLYYIDLYDPAIYRWNPDTMQKEIVRGERWSEEAEDDESTVWYRQIFMMGDKLYYLNDQKDAGTKLYLYDENGDDKLQYEMGKSEKMLGTVVTDSSKIFYKYLKDKGNYKLKEVDLITGKEEERSIPKRFEYGIKIIDGTLLYTTTEGNRYYVMDLE